MVTTAKSSDTKGKNFLFREVRGNILIGTASGRYVRWIGQDRKKRMAQGTRVIEQRAYCDSQGIRPLMRKPCRLRA